MPLALPKASAACSSPTARLSTRETVAKAQRHELTSGAAASRRFQTTSCAGLQTASRQYRANSSAAQAQPARARESEEAPSIRANIAMVGAGNMGGAMLKGWMDSGIVDAGSLAACVRGDDKAQAWKPLGVEVFRDMLDEEEARQLCAFADVIFLGVKPQYLGPVIAAIAPHVTRSHTVVSIAAGWTLAQLEGALPEGTPVMRVMPNTPVLVGVGACAYCLGKHAGPEDRQVLATLLESSGVALEVEEEQIDAVIGVAGSAPAYMFQVLEAMADGGVAAGLPRDKALLLAAQTMKGSAEMVLSGVGGAPGAALGHPGVLKDQVTSPAGVTIAALGVLEEAGVRSAFIKTVGAAAAKSRDMASLAPARAGDS